MPDSTQPAGVTGASGLPPPAVSTDQGTDWLDGLARTVKALGTVGGMAPIAGTFITGAAASVGEVLEVIKVSPVYKRLTPPSQNLTLQSQDIKKNGDDLRGLAGDLVGLMKFVQGEIAAHGATPASGSHFQRLCNDFLK